MEISYILNHYGELHDEYYGAVAPPVIQSSNFRFNTIAQMHEAFLHEDEQSVYTRGINPTIQMAASKLAALEGAEQALLLSSGAAAIATAVISQVKAGDHIVSVNNPYSWTYKLLTQLLPRFNVTATFIDGTEIANFVEATQHNTTVYMLESPTTMYFELQDLTAISQLAKQRGITTIIDNSYSTMLVQKPISMGIDIVVYSATKYLNGHSDVVAGAICASKQLIKKIFHTEFMTLGSIIAPWNAWLLMRGLRTLPIRLAHISQSTQSIVKFLHHHPAIEKIYWPFISDNPQLSLAQKQMSMPLGLFSVLLNTHDESAIRKFCENLQYFLMAVSWGGHESLIIPALAFPQPHSFPKNFVRFYIGLEQSDELLADLASGLAHIK